MENSNNETKIEPTEVKTKRQAEIMIPKHRFDCVNLCLKEIKQALKEKVLDLEANKALIVKLKKMLLISKVETVLAQHNAKNLTAVKALIDFSNLKLEHNGTVPGLEEEVLRVKKSQSYLFESQEEIIYAVVQMQKSMF